jgi:hypothetical protein
MDKPNVFFNPIVNKDEKMGLLQSIVEKKGKILVRLDDGSKSLIFPHKFSGERGLMCAIEKKEDLERLHSKSVFLHFSIDKNYYFFESKCLKSLDQIAISFKSPIFILQQRANARVNIPDEFNVDFLITKHKQLIMEHHSKFIDISLGGCKVTLIDFPENIVKEDILEAKIILPSKKEFVIKGQIKNVKLDVYTVEIEKEKVERKKHEIGVMFMLDPKKPKDFEKFYISLQQEIADSLNTQEADEIEG